MQIRFLGQAMEILPPVPGDAEIVIAPESLTAISLPNIRRTDTSLSFFNLRKIIYFLAREGISLTYSKVRAVLAHRKLARQRILVAAIGKDVETGQPVLAFGGQDCPEAEQLCFPRLLALSGYTGDAASDIEALAAYAAANPETVVQLRDWSRYSGSPPAASLGEILAAGRVSDGPSRKSDSLTTTTIAVPRPANAAPVSATNSDRREGLFLAGAGTYPCSYALPVFAKARVPFDTVVDLNPARACQVRSRYGFRHADTDAHRALERLAEFDRPILVISTYHSTHIDIADRALAVNPSTRIMIEKPPVTTVPQLERLLRLRDAGSQIEIGYNRRHAPIVEKASEQVAARSGPIAMTCIVKELKIPPSHWYFWPAQGTRITGNTCHWLDLGRYFIDSEPRTLTVAGATGPIAGSGETVVVSYSDGSSLTIVASDIGNPLRGVQEFIEIRRDDLTLTIEDFVRMRVQAGARSSVHRRILRDKGHRRMYARFLRNVETDNPVEYPNEDLWLTSMQYLLASKAVQTGQTDGAIELPGRAPSNAGG